jgi:betaine-aldehyde dehydrogenase
VAFAERLDRIFALREALRRNRERMAALAMKNLMFTPRDSLTEVDVTVDRLALYEGADFLKGRVPLRGRGSSVALLLSYNGSAWLSTAITSVFVVGNRVRVKFSSKGADVMALTEEMYRPIFGEDVTFYSGSGRAFIEESLRDKDTAAVIVFGFDETVLPYEEAFRRTGKTLVFEGPGQDPFIVFPDADMSFALDDLMTAKFMYSGQTCTAPKRIFVHRSVYEEFLERFVERVRGLVVGDPADPKTDVTPVASRVAVERIRRQLEEAASRGGRVLAGGRIEGTLVFPTVVRDATDDMLGMREEVFGPVAFTTSFETEEEVLRRARDHRYGLRAAVFGGEAAGRAARALAGEPYCHPVPGYTFGTFGTVALNETRAESWKGAFVVKAVGGYGYSGWIWETADGRFHIKQGPKLLRLETSVPGEPPSP